jgi:hypothetical protein
VSIVRLLPLVFLVGACGGSGAGSGAAPARGPDVVIPDVTEEQAETSKEEAAPLAGARQNPVMPEVPVEPEPGMGEDIWGGFAGGSPQARGGPDCDQAADCCLKFYQKSGGDPSVSRICGSMRSAPSTLCAQLLQSFQTTAPSVGVQCP